MIDISNREELETWLEDKPIEWSQVLATRISLRILPLIFVGFESGNLLREDQQILSRFRAMFISWAARKYPAHDMASTAKAAAEAVNAIPNANATPSVTASAAASAAASTPANSHAEFWTSINEDCEILLGYGPLDPAALRLIAQVLWSARTEGLPFPEWVSEAVTTLERALLAIDGNWHVWIDWYRHILHTHPCWELRAENAERLTVRIAEQNEQFWEKSPKAVNAVIAEWLATLREDEAKEIAAPEQPLGSDRAATSFIFAGGKIDTAAPTAWADDTEIAESLRKAALDIARELQQRFLSSNAEPKLSASISKGVDVLDRPVSSIQPDELRLFAQSISAKARAYGHQNAEWELSVDTVEGLFRFSSLLEDLQGIVKSDLQQNAEDIRALEITPEHLKQAKAISDDFQQAVGTSSSLFTKNAEEIFQTAATISDNAPTQKVQIQVEGERILISENLARALAREIPTMTAIEVFGEKSTENNNSAKNLPEFGHRFIKQLLETPPEEVAVAVARDPIKSFGVISAAFIAAAATLGPIITATSITVTAAWLSFNLRKKIRKLDERDKRNAKNPKL